MENVPSQRQESLHARDLSDFQGQHHHRLRLDQCKAFASTAVEQTYEEISITIEVCRTTDRVHRFLLWNLVFICEIHREMFRYCLIDDEASIDAVFGSYELDADDEGYMYSLGLCLQRACDRVGQNQLSLLIAHDRSRITEDVVIPARILNTEPEYLCEQLMSYPKHKSQSEKRYKTVLYSQGGKNRFFGFARKWNNEDSRTHLAKCLVSDDCIVSAITPTETLQVTLGHFIAEFSNKHRKRGLGMGSVERKIYFQDSTYRLLQAVMIRNQIAQPNIRNRPSQSWSRSTSAYQQYALEILQTPFGPRSAVLREEYEEEEAGSLESTQIPCKGSPKGFSLCLRQQKGRRGSH